MSEKIYNYAISYDLYSAMSFGDKLLAFVKENRNFLAWSRPYEGMYFVKSSEPLDTIVATFRHFFGIQTNHFIYAVSPGFVMGIAPAEFWTWLHTNDTPRLLAWAGSK